MQIRNSQIEINLSYLDNNVSYFKSLVSNKTNLMAVIKANAYGHGIIKVANFLDSNQNIQYFGVATCGEAVKLRKNKIKKNILILGNIFPEQVKSAIQNNIEITVSNQEQINNIQKASKKLNQQAKIHLMIDTGMGRVGCNIEDLELIIKRIKESNNINLIGISTHFSESEIINSEYTIKQIQTFKEAINILIENGFKELIKHCANTNGTINYPDSHFDMVRIGLGLYGYSTPVQSKLNKVMTVKSKIVNIKNISKGKYLGYSRTYKAEKDMVIGIIPMGYADGFNRNLSNKQSVLINNQLCDVVGNVSMDQTIVDLTGLEDIKVNDSVIILGNNDINQITAKQLAENSNRISYEILCSFGNAIDTKKYF